MKLRVCILALFAAALPLAAQQTPPPSTPPDKPKTTELQDARLDDYQARITEIQTRLQAQMAVETAPWIQKGRALIDEIQKANPDFVWHDAAGPGDKSGWVHKPAPAAAVTNPTQTTPTPAAAETPKK
jgi:hypothetical protein